MLLTLPELRRDGHLVCGTATRPRVLSKKISVDRLFSLLNFACFILVRDTDHTDDLAFKIALIRHTDSSVSPRIRGTVYQYHRRQM